MIVIAGPCVIENRESVFQVAQVVRELQNRFPEHMMI